MNLGLLNDTAGYVGSELEGQFFDAIALRTQISTYLTRQNNITTSLLFVIVTYVVIDQIINLKQ